MSFDPNAIGNRIFTLRTNAKLSQEKLAEKLGVSHRHLGDLERGSSNGSVKILIDIAEYFHVSMDYLLLGREPPRDQFQNELQAAIDHLEKICRFVELYHSEYSKSRLIAKLRQVDAFTIFRLARTAGVSLPGKTKYLQQVYTIYNGGSRRAALPLKF